VVWGAAWERRARPGWHERVQPDQVGTQPTLAQGHPVSKTKISLSKTGCKGGRCPLAKFSRITMSPGKKEKLSVHQQRTSTLHVQHQIFPIENDLYVNDALGEM